MFRYDWSPFDTKMGLIFMVGEMVGVVVAVVAIAILARLQKDAESPKG